MTRMSDFAVSDPSEAMSGETRACRDLWAAVLMECLTSALRSRMEQFGEIMLDPSGCGRHVPFGWISTQDFIEVCELAGFNGQHVRAIVRRKTVAIEDCMAFYRLLKAPSDLSEAK